MEYGVGALSSLQTGVVRHSRSKSFYSADQRLRYFQENVVAGGSSVTREGVWEEYRYDPLGRRVLVRSNRDDLCNAGGTGSCISHVTRYVWSGDQLLWELRLDSEERENLETLSSTGLYHGRVSYFHAGGIDRPLVIRKEGQPAIIPHENWRGQFSRGTYTSGAVSDCTGQTTACTQVNWPGYRTTAWHQRSGSGPDIRTWFGGLVEGMRDQSGKIYMRNRYYDPETGQFTQTDPIGLAGGLNAYGFAAGDPVTYSDPYGLKVCYKGTQQEVKQLQTATEQATGAAVFLDGNNCVRAVGNSMNAGLQGLRNRLFRLASRPTVYNVGFRASANGSWFGSGCDNLDTHFCPTDQVVEIDAAEIGRRMAADYPGCYFFGRFGPKVTQNLPAIIAHELLGHAWQYDIATGDVYNDRERPAIKAENNYHGTEPGGRTRCLG